LNAKLFEKLKGKEKEVLDEGKSCLEIEVRDGIRKGIVEDPFLCILCKGRRCLKETVKKERDARIVMNVGLKEGNESLETTHQTRYLIV